MAKSERWKQRPENSTWGDYGPDDQLGRMNELNAERTKQAVAEVKAGRYAGGAFPFADNEFDVCWSNAVIEHVGTHERQVLFLREIARVGRRAYITTPNRFFPVEVHTRIPLLHYLPKPWFDAILRRIGKEWAAGDYMYLLSLSELKAELREAGTERFKIFRNRLLGFTLDFVVVVEPGNPS